MKEKCDKKTKTNVPINLFNIGIISILGIPALFSLIFIHIIIF
ncbi:hypothetical protein EGP64_03020 [bacterium]|nr:hypothetical protein [bacterium]